ncbi:BRO1-like domain-containing protein [Phthorimaea operculella]|nr:BRO1-like domain-containing protein [Phthorimaea operculella]
MAELLSIPLKKSSDVDLVKPLRNLIQATYSGAEGLEDCTEAVGELAKLRGQAIWKLFDKSSLDVIYNYYDQLASLESKVPPQEVAVPFKWKDAFDRGSIFGGRMSLTVSSLAFERVCVLWNMGALQSSLAAKQPLDTEDSLKLAAKLCQQAAGIFSHLKGNVLMAVHAEPTPDLQPDTLHALAQLMLAQAQEVIVYKCIRDEMKEGTIAKVCASCEEMYTDAMRAMNKEQLRALWDREWLPTLHAKQHAFRGLTQLYQAAVCGTSGAVGEQIARLQIAVDALKAAGAGPAGAGGRLAGVQPLADAAARATRQLADAMKDNDFIYHERIPDAAQLEPVQRVAIAKALPLPEKWGQGKDLFEQLVPLAVHGAIQASAARKAEAVGTEVNKLRDATQLLNSILASLSLPACVESCGASGSGLPESIKERANAVRAAGGLPALQSLVAELPDLLQRNRDILNEAERMLREEAEADAQLRSQFGARWTRTESAKLTEAFRANAAKYTQIIDNAVRADNIVQQKFQQHKDNIALLSGSESDITAGVPAASGGSSNADGEAAGTLRKLMRDVEALKQERDALEGSESDITAGVPAASGGSSNADGEAAGTLRKLMRDVEALKLEGCFGRFIALLSGSESDITAGVPAASGGSSNADGEAAGTLRKLMRDVEALKQERDALEGGSSNADGEAAGTLRKLMRDVEALKQERDALEAELKNVNIDLKEQFAAAHAAGGGVDEAAITASALGAAMAPLQRRVQATIDKQEALVAGKKNSYQ